MRICHGLFHLILSTLSSWWHPDHWVHQTIVITRTSCCSSIWLIAQLENEPSVTLTAAGSQRYLVSLMCNRRYHSLSSMSRSLEQSRPSFLSPSRLKCSPALSFIDFTHWNNTTLFMALCSFLIYASTGLLKGTRYPQKKKKETKNEVYSNRLFVVEGMLSFTEMIK